jgi:hypothetical protein
MPVTLRPAFRAAEIARVTLACVNGTLTVMADVGLCDMSRLIDRFHNRGSRPSVEHSLRLLNPLGGLRPGNEPDRCRVMAETGDYGSRGGPLPTTKIRINGV